MLRQLIIVILLSCSLVSGVYALQEKLNINTADAETIAAVLDGVGDIKAQSIVEFRNTHGPFESVEALVKVKGIGVQTLAKNIDKITINED